jgi:hypothetical protein
MALTQLWIQKRQETIVTSLGSKQGCPASRRRFDQIIDNEKRLQKVVNAPIAPSRILNVTGNRH